MDTALIRNIAVSDNADSELALYPTVIRNCAVSNTADPQSFFFEYEYLREFENILGCESGAYLGSFHEKTRSKKSRATVPLNVPGRSVSVPVCTLLANAY